MKGRSRGVTHPDTAAGPIPRWTRLPLTREREAEVLSSHYVGAAASSKTAFYQFTFFSAHVTPLLSAFILIAIFLRTAHVKTADRCGVPGSCR